MKMKKGSGVALGIIFGTVLGVVTDNLGLWLSMGIVFGAAYESKISKSEFILKNSGTISFIFFTISFLLSSLAKTNSS